MTERQDQASGLNEKREVVLRTAGRRIMSGPYASVAATDMRLTDRRITTILWSNDLTTLSLILL